MPLEDQLRALVSDATSEDALMQDLGYVCVRAWRFGADQAVGGFGDVTDGLWRRKVRRAGRSRRLAIIGAFAVVVPALGAAPASAAPCPVAPALTVAGTTPGVQGVPLQVVGDDCLVRDDNSVRVLNPKLGGFGGVPGSVTIEGAMILAADRSQMTREVLTAPLTVRVDGDPVVTGPIEIRDVQFCDLAPPGAGPAFQLAPSALLPAPQEGEVGVNVGLPQLTNCRLVPGMVLTAPTFGAILRVLGLDPAGRPGQVPFLIDNERGGRIVGVVPFRIPVPNTPVSASGAPALGFMVEVSRTLGTQLIGVAGQYARGFTIPGTDIGVREIGLTVVPAESRFGGGTTIHAGGFRTRGEFEVRDQRIQRLAAAVALPRPGVAIFAPNFLATGVNFGFRAAQSFPLPTGGSITLPTTLSGAAGWTLSESTRRTGIGGQMNLTLGNGMRLSGTYCLFTPLRACTVQLGAANAFVRANPFRLETSGSINVLSGQMLGSVTGAATLNPFHVTYFGNLTVKVPTIVPIVGGTTVGGLSSAVSERGAAALVRIPNPNGEDPTFAVATMFSPLSTQVVSGLSSVITVQASQNGRSRGLRLPRGLGQVLVEVRGARRAPRSVRLTIAGRTLRTTRLAGAGRTVTFIVANPPAGRLRVRSPDRVARVKVSEIGTFPYLDPAPGVGTRPRPPITAGTPVRVCWNVRSAGRGLQVDLLEDQDGRLGVGRTIAEDRPAKGCASIATDDFEPGRHWVYGVVHTQQDVPISARYWPIGIEVSSPTALPAPSGLTVTPTGDGAKVAFTDVEGASFYVIRAEPAEPGVVPPVELQVASGAESELSLRGAASWRVFVQAADAEGHPGNIAGPITVSPSSAVVVAGTPNGLAEIGKPWAFELRTANVARLRLVAGPRGARLASSGLLRWTPRRSAIRDGFVRFAVEGCSADDRCVTRAFSVTAFSGGRVPFGPIRGFRVLQSAVRPGQRITLIAQGVRGPVRVEVDGRRVRARALDSGSVRATLPARLADGGHDVSLQIGGNLEETAPGAIVVR